MTRVAWIVIVVFVSGCSGRKGEIERTMAAYDLQLLQLNADSLAQFYLPNGVLKGEGQPAVVGPDSIKKFLKGFKRVLVMEQESQTSAIKIMGDSAIHQGTYRQVVTFPARRQTLELGGQFEAIWVDTGNTGWKLGKMQTGNYTSKEINKR